MQKRSLAASKPVPQSVQKPALVAFVVLFAFAFAFAFAFVFAFAFAFAVDVVWLLLLPGAVALDADAAADDQKPPWFVSGGSSLFFAIKHSE